MSASPNLDTVRGWMVLSQAHCKSQEDRLQHLWSLQADTLAPAQRLQERKQLCSWAPMTASAIRFLDAMAANPHPGREDREIMKELNDLVNLNDYIKFKTIELVEAVGHSLAKVGLDDAELSGSEPGEGEIGRAGEARALPSASNKGELDQERDETGGL